MEENVYNNTCTAVPVRKETVLTNCVIYHLVPLATKWYQQHIYGVYVSIPRWTLKRGKKERNRKEKKRKKLNRSKNKHAFRAQAESRGDKDDTIRPDGRQDKKRRGPRRRATSKTKSAVLCPAGGPRTTQETQRRTDEGLKNNSNEIKQNKTKRHLNKTKMEHRVTQPTQSDRVPGGIIDMAQNWATQQTKNRYGNT